MEEVTFGNIDWRPLTRTGNSFRTHELVLSEHGMRASFKVPAMTYFLAVVVSAISVFMALSFFVRCASFKSWLLLVGCIMWGGLSLWMLYCLHRPIVFDRVLNYYWKGGRPPDPMCGEVMRKQCAPLHHIVALQIVAKECASSNQDTYTSYELNLILKDKARLHVVNHRDLASIQKDARALAVFLGVPCWDASIFFPKEKGKRKG